ncbi:hypothetical protein DSCA_46050 [Desulfosarcina alkanivorans]|uniref:Uncharacterized protein n=1 Tax=Desulfosarcina alkanivorans TaxID=571177 RepID=A0A5K7YQS3_9BACT|nr:hypothetical protein DSCA_46050 [Desulfosarcina alkanivorans]
MAVGLPLEIAVYGSPDKNYSALSPIPQQFAEKPTESCKKDIHFQKGHRPNALPQFCDPFT